MTFADGATCVQLLTLVGLPPPNAVPVANAGANQTVTVGSIVRLDGSASSDINGNPLTFRWALITVPAGSTATLTNIATPAPTFVPDVPGLYIAQLIVNDGMVNSTPQVVTIMGISALTPQGVIPPAAVACTPSPTGLVAWWSGDSSSQDVSGRMQHAVLTSGAQAAIAGKVSGAFLFNGLTGVATTPILLPLQGTLELWMNPTAFDAVHGVLGTFGTANGDDRLWLVTTGASGGPGVGPNRLVVNLGSRSVNNVDIPNPFTLGVWTHLALTFDYVADLYTLYVNGRAIATSTAARNAPTNVFSFGAVPSDFGQNFFFHGLLDEVTLYNRVLAASEVLAIVNADTAGKCNGGDAGTPGSSDGSGSSGGGGCTKIRVITAIASARVVTARCPGYDNHRKTALGAVGCGSTT